MTRPGDGEGLWIRFLSGPDIDARSPTSAEIVVSVGVGTMLRCR